MACDILSSLNLNTCFPLIIMFNGIPWELGVILISDSDFDIIFT
jgi:hypothetical protein